MTWQEDGHLPDSAFGVLGFVAEGEAQGYELQHMIHDRGFRFWTSVKRSSIYNALALLERRGCIAARLVSAEVPDRRMYPNHGSRE